MSYKLETLAPRVGSKKSRKRVGRGEGSGLGKTSGKGHKGQKARSGGSVARHFEGGQMPLYRRIPKLGFRSRAQKEGLKNLIHEVDITLLNKVPSGAIVNKSDLGILVGVKPGSVLASRAKYKLLGKGPLSNKVEVEADAVSAGALAAIEAAGGKVILAAQSNPE